MFVHAVYTRYHFEGHSLFTDVQLKVWTVVSNVLLALLHSSRTVLFSLPCVAHHRIVNLQGVAEKCYPLAL